MFQKQRFINRALIIAIACITTLFVANAAGQEVKTVLFKDANTALAAARNSQADVLAPKNFDEGMKRYQEAEADLKQGNCPSQQSMPVRK